MKKATLKGIAQFNAHKDKGLTWDEWQDKCPEAIEAMEETDPTFFGALYASEFGVNPFANGSRPVSAEAVNQFAEHVNANWSWDEWQEKAPAALEAMAELNKPRFNALYKAEFGVIPQ